MGCRRKSVIRLSDSLGDQGRCSAKTEDGYELVKPRTLRAHIGERKTCSGNPEQTRMEGEGSKREHQSLDEAQEVGLKPGPPGAS